MVVLENDVIDLVKSIGKADIVVGIPSFRNADTIAHVVRQSAIGMVEYFPELKPVLINSDGGSEDKTRDVVLDTPVPPQVQKIVTPYRGVAGKGSAFKTIFEIATMLKTDVCIVVDSDLRSITPEWIRSLGQPILQDRFDFITPHYLRYKYDGTITNNLAYPLTRALYGLRVRQPIGGDFGFSGVLAGEYSRRDVWETDIARFGIDIWMTTLAICEGFRVGQSHIGLKLHNNKDPGSDLGAMFRHVAGTLFFMMNEYEDKWIDVRKSRTAPVLGEETTDEPEETVVSYDNLIDHFHIGYDQYKDIWRDVMRKENYSAIEKAYYLSDDAFELSGGLWARVVYDFAIAFNFGSLPMELTVDSLMPLYCGRTAHFVKKTADMTTFEAELEVERGAEIFEALKEYLTYHWQTAKQNGAGY